MPYKGHSRREREEEKLREEKNERGRGSMLQKWATPATLVSTLHAVLRLS